MEALQKVKNHLMDILILEREFPPNPLGFEIQKSR